MYTHVGPSTYVYIYTYTHINTESTVPPELATSITEMAMKFHKVTVVISTSISSTNVFISTLLVVRDSRSGVIILLTR